MKDYIKRNWVQIVLGLALGALVMSTVLSEELPVDESGVDIPVDMPTVVIPIVQIPVVVLPVVVVPQVTIVTTITSAQLALLVDSPDILLNKIVIPSVASYGSVLSYDTPAQQYVLPTVGHTDVAKVNGIVLPSTTTPTVTQFGTPSVYTQKPLSNSDLINKIIIPSIENAGKGVNENLTRLNDSLTKETVFQKTDHPKNFIQDKRTVQYLKDGGSSNLIWKAWKEIYAKDYPPMAYIRVPDVTQIKMICEMKATRSQAERDNLMAELLYFKTLGYNTVLAIWEGEQPTVLLEQIAIVKGIGLKVFFSYGTRERLDDKIFIDPEKYRYGLTLLASSCDGYLVGWRRTSLHLFKADNKFVDYSISCVRQGNPSIPVFGEIYRGYAGNNNKDGSHNENEFLVNIPANASGAFVVNFGYQGVRPDGVLKLIRASTDVPLIALIVGERPYYMSRYDNKKSKAENRTIIDSIEKRFKKFDFGTATLAGDGSNEVYNKNVSDDISEMHWSKL